MQYNMYMAHFAPTLLPWKVLFYIKTYNIPYLLPDFMQYMDSILKQGYLIQDFNTSTTKIKGY